MLSTFFYISFLLLGGLLTTDGYGDSMIVRFAFNRYNVCRSNDGSDDRRRAAVALAVGMQTKPALMITLRTVTMTPEK